MASSLLKELNAKDLKKFRKAVKDDYYFQMYYDDLPIWGFIGKIEKILKPGQPEMRYYLFTHVHFDIAYNNDRVIEINVSTDPLRTVDITEVRVRVRPRPPRPFGFGRFHLFIHAVLRASPRGVHTLPTHAGV